MRKTKTQKGITLVALIITIIVLLILAIVAIGAVQNDGIIQYAKNARSDYEKAQTNEKALLENYLTKLDKNNPTKPEEKTTTITITGGDSPVNIGNSITLGLTADKGTISATDVTWTSSNPQIANIDDNGVVLAKKSLTTNGSVATITAKLKADNTIVATKAITVMPIKCADDSQCKLNNIECENCGSKDYIQIEIILSNYECQVCEASWLSPIEEPDTNRSCEHYDYVANGIGEIWYKCFNENCVYGESEHSSQYANGKVIDTSCDCHYDATEYK